MSTIAEALARIGALRDAANDPRGAYLIRSRLRRALLTCARGIAEEQGLDKPKRPGEWVLGPDAPADLGKVADIGRRIHQRAEHLCQPSESFDVRWEQGWSELQSDLGKLERALLTLR